MESAGAVGASTTRRRQAEPHLRALSDIVANVGHVHRRDRRPTATLALFHWLPGR